MSFEVITHFVTSITLNRMADKIFLISIFLCVLKGFGYLFFITNGQVHSSTLRHKTLLTAMHLRSEKNRTNIV